MDLGYVVVRGLDIVNIALKCVRNDDNSMKMAYAYLLMGDWVTLGTIWKRISKDQSERVNVWSEVYEV